MLIIYSRLLDKLTGEAIDLFCHILKRCDNLNPSFTPQYLLQKETSYSRDKTAKTIKSLIFKQVLKIEQSKSQGKFSTNISTLLTPIANTQTSKF